MADRRDDRRDGALWPFACARGGKSDRLRTSSAAFPSELTRLASPLARTAKHLASGEPLKIVAIGSSSTAGAGASSPAHSYPSRLAVELATLFPKQPITVVNRGVNGEETPDMLARFDARRDRRKARSRDLAGRHQRGVARSSARAGRNPDARRTGQAESDRRRRDPDRSAILPEGAREDRCRRAWSI